VAVTRSASRTALTAAAARAAHLIVDAPPTIFADPLAARLLGDEAEQLLSYHRQHGAHPVLAGARAQVVCRSRYAENRLAEAVERGTRQYVLLGAGLDSFAHRGDQAVRVFEVDHPTSQADKRERVSRVGLTGEVSYVDVDFDSDDLLGRLVGGGFDPSRPAVVSWLGVSMYLTPAVIEDTVARLGGLAAGTELILDYYLPEGLRDEDGQSYVDQVAQASAEWGEPWRSYFAPDELTELLRRAGYAYVIHSGQRESVPAAMWDRSDALRPARLAAIAHARI
jgi:methyltransferase (TIGR00027 family)